MKLGQKIAVVPHKDSPETPVQPKRLVRWRAFWSSRDGIVLAALGIFVGAVTTGGFMVDAMIGCFALGGSSLLVALLLGYEPKGSHAVPAEPRT